MKSRRTRFVAIATLGVLIAVGWLAYTRFATPNSNKFLKAVVSLHSIYDIDARSAGMLLRPFGTACAFRLRPRRPLTLDQLQQVFGSPESSDIDSAKFSFPCAGKKVPFAGDVWEPNIGVVAHITEENTVVLMDVDIPSSDVLCAFLPMYFLSKNAPSPGQLNSAEHARDTGLPGRQAAPSTHAESNGASSKSLPDPSATANQAAVMITQGQPSQGPQDAKVVVVEFSDFQCSDSAQAHKKLKDLLIQYGRHARVVHRNHLRSRHGWAELAAIAGECVFNQDEATFWILRDFYFEHQNELTVDNLEQRSRDALTGSPIDFASFNECLARKATLGAVRADEAEARRLDLRAPPSFQIFHNGMRIKAERGNAIGFVQYELEKASGVR